MNQPTFSLIIGTARPSYGSIKGSDEHLLKITLDSLESQSFKDFEVVIVDALYRKRDLSLEIVQLGNWSFPWRVVRPKSAWLDKGLWSLQNSFNRGFMASYGKYVYFCGDCCEFPSGSLTRAKVLVEEGYAPSFLFAYKMEGFLSKVSEGCWEPSDVDTVELAITKSLWSDKFYRDSRWTHVEKLGGFCKPSDFHWDMVYGYQCVKREDFLHVNGYDENFDGDKGLGDVELGSRLQRAGRWINCLSSDMYVYEHQHHAVDSSVFVQGLGSIRSNYDLIYLMRKRDIWRANSTVFTKQECIDVIKASITNIPAWPDFKITPDELTYQYQQFWMENQSVFELSQLKE